MSVLQNVICGRMKMMYRYFLEYPLERIYTNQLFSQGEYSFYLEAQQEVGKADVRAECHLWAEI